MRRPPATRPAPTDRRSAAGRGGLGATPFCELTGELTVRLLSAEDFEPAANYPDRHLQWFPPGAPDSEIVEAVRKAFADPPVKGGTLTVDQAEGRAVFEQARDAGTGAHVCGLTVTAGHPVELDGGGGWLVPKKVLVGVLQVLLQEKRRCPVDRWPDRVPMPPA